MGKLHAFKYKQLYTIREHTIFENNRKETEKQR